MLHLYSGIRYINCSLEKEADVNYNTKLFTIKLPGASHMIVPTGHHISIKAKDKQGTYILYMCSCMQMYL